MSKCMSSAALGCTQRCHITITSGDPANSLPFITLQPLCLEVLLLPRTCRFCRSTSVQYCAKFTMLRLWVPCVG